MINCADADPTHKSEPTTPAAIAFETLLIPVMPLLLKKTGISLTEVVIELFLTGPEGGRYISDDIGPVLTRSLGSDGRELTWKPDGFLEACGFF